MFRERPYSCRRKRPHYSKADANKRLNLMKASGDTVNKRTLEVYKCKHCGLYHIGHNNPGFILKERIERARWTN